MAAGRFLDNMMSKVRSVYDRFFFGDAPAPAVQEENYGGQQPQAGTWQAAGYTAPQGYQQQVNAPYSQAGMQQGHQQPQPMGYQPPYGNPAYPPQQAQQSAPQQQPQPRFKRSMRGNRNNNVVYFDGHNPINQPAEPQEAEQPAAKEQTGTLLSARIINAKSMSDCRSAISLLRGGDAVLVVMENINEPAEMRRLVDTLSGACYSLTATITKVSRYGVYLLAPQAVAVYADQATNAMNSAPGRAPVRPVYQSVQRPAYPPQAQSAYQPQPAQNGFTQQTAAPEEAPRNFYQRPQPQQAQPVGFSAQPAAYGYAPDEPAAAAQ